jgi:hypothetical protein
LGQFSSLVYLRWEEASLRGQGREADLIDVILNSIQDPLVNKYEINSGSRDNNHEPIG